MRFISSAGAVLLSFASYASAIDFNPDDEASIKTVTSTYAYGLMTHYTNNATGLPKEEIGIFKKPHYWWEAGAAWGGLIEYTQLTGDGSYVKTLTQALEANYGPKNDIILPWRRDQQGNDDQAFWAFAIMSALEYGFPEPENAPAKYIDVVVNAFENIVSRWNETVCEGGLKWQIYPENAYGYNYRNSISNGAVFALGARLARYTGEKKYADWAVKLYDWSVKKNLVSGDFAVFDGTDEKDNCGSVSDKTEWTYNNAVYLHGAAVMFDYTKGDETWKKRTEGFLNHAGVFFKPYDNATDIMYERPCETGETGRKCNLDQQSFKAYLARFLAKTAILAPFTKDQVTKYLRTSAVAAAKACSGDKNVCGSKWYTGNWDGTSGVGQQLSALEVTQSLLLLKRGVLPKKAGESDKPKPAPSSTAAPKASDKSDPPKTTEKPKDTGAPPKTDAPKATDKPANTDAPKATDKPKDTGAPAPTSTGKPATSGKPAKFPEGPNCSQQTTTVYVSLLPSQPPVPVPSGGYKPPTNNTASTTGPPQPVFTGVASSLKVTALSALAAVAVAFIGFF